MSDEPALIPISPWDSMAKCPKCESMHDDLGVIWNKTGKGKVNEIEYEFEELKKGVPYEHLEMNCKKCGYQWLMETSDFESRKTSLEIDEVSDRTSKEDLEALKDEGEPEEHPVIKHPGAGHLRRIRGHLPIPPL